MWIMDDWPLNDFTFCIARSTRVGAGMDLMNLIIREVSRGLLTWVATFSSIAYFLSHSAFVRALEDGFDAKAAFSNGEMSDHVV
jgi:hypothetical protein